MPLNDCAELLSTLRLRGQIPVASGSWTAAEMLRAASEEAATHMLPLLLKARGEYLVRTTDLPTVQGTATYRLPYRAVALREVKLVGSDGVDRGTLTVIEPEKLTAYGLGTAQQGVPKFATFEDGNVRLSPVPMTTGDLIRVKWHIRPSRMTDTSNATRISAIVAGGSTTAFTVAAIPAAMNLATQVDLIRAQGRFEILGFDLTTAALATAGLTITIANALLPTGPDYPAVGDYFALAGYTPFPNFPAECHSPIALRAAAAVVRSKGDNTLADSLVKEAGAKEVELLTGVLTPRSHGNTRKLVNRRFF